MKLDTLVQRMSEKGIDLLLQLLLAIVIWIVGSYLIKTFKKVIIKSMEKKGVDPSLKSFLGSLITAVLYVMLVIITISTIWSSDEFFSSSTWSSRACNWFSTSRKFVKLCRRSTYNNIQTF